MCDFKKDKKCGISDCTRYHHRLLHQDKESGHLTVEDFLRQAKLEREAEEKEAKEKGSSLITRDGVTLLSKGDYDAIRTCAVYLISPNGKKEKIWVALDSCSTSTNIDAETAKRMNLKIEEAAVERHIGVLQSSVNIQSDIVSFVLQTLDGKTMYPVKAFTVKNLVEGTPVIDWNQVAEECPHLKKANIPKADPKDLVRILLGFDNNHLMIASANLQGGDNQPYAKKCKLGWSFSGKVDRKFVVSPVSDDRCGWTHSFFKQSLAIRDGSSDQKRLVKHRQEIIFSSCDSTFQTDEQKVAAVKEEKSKLKDLALISNIFHKNERLPSQK